MITFGDLEINNKIYIIIPESFEENNLSSYEIKEIEYSENEIRFWVGSQGVIVIPKSYEDRSFYNEKDFVDIVLSDIRLFDTVKQCNNYFTN